MKAKETAMGKLHYCPVCGLAFEDEIWAKKCEDWDKKYKGCNLEIARHAVNKEKIKGMK